MARFYLHTVADPKPGKSTADLSALKKPSLRGGRILTTLLLGVLSVARVMGAGQDDGTQTVPPPPAPPPLGVPLTPAEKKAVEVNPVTGLVTVSSSNYRALNRKERWDLYWRQNYVSVGAYVGPVFTALLLDQASGTPEQWGGGMEGYGRRVVSRLGQAFIQGTVQAPLAAVLHEDVRYISSARHGFRHRALHAILFSFLTYNSSGRPVPNVANFIGYYASSAVATYWLPGEHYRAGYAFSTASEQMVLAVPINFLQEFWPEVHRKIFHH